MVGDFCCFDLNLSYLPFNISLERPLRRDVCPCVGWMLVELSSDKGDCGMLDCEGSWLGLPNMMMSLLTTFCL